MRLTCSQHALEFQFVFNLKKNILGASDRLTITGLQRMTKCRLQRLMPRSAAKDCEHTNSHKPNRAPTQTARCWRVSAVRPTFSFRTCCCLSSSLPWVTPQASTSLNDADSGRPLDGLTALQ